MKHYGSIETSQLTITQYSGNVGSEVGDMLDSVINFLNQDELNNKCTFLDLLRLRQSIPGSWRHILEL